MNQRKQEIYASLNRLNLELHNLEREERIETTSRMVGKFYRIIYVSDGRIDYTHITGVQGSGLTQNYFIINPPSRIGTIDFTVYLDKNATPESFKTNDRRTVEEITKRDFDMALDKAICDITHNLRKAYENGTSIEG